MSGARGVFDELKRRADPIPDAEVDAFWAALPPAAIEDMLGEWSGGEFDTGHRMNGLGQSEVVRRSPQPPTCNR